MKKAFYISLSLNICFILFFAGKRYYYSYGAGAGRVPTQDSLCVQHMTEMDNYYNQFDIDSGDIVFMGNSLTEDFKVHEYFGDVKNRGIGCNTITDILNRLTTVTSGRPKAIFMEIGINDLRNGHRVDSVYNRLQRLTLLIQKQSPNTKVYIQSLTPTCGEYAYLNPLVSELNNLLKSQPNYIDIHTPMLRGGCLDSTLSTDGLHLNENGYHVWQKQLRKYF